jgi:large subunit ribosomal protein L17
MLSQTPTERLARILEAAGGPFVLHNPSTWPTQANLAAQGKWHELKKFQEHLIAGETVHG